MSGNNQNDIMQESQSIEWKWSWQDEFLKWLCGYANTDGGTLNIGVNDDGYLVGLEDSKDLLERLPNKITDKLGILASVRVLSGKQGDNLRYGLDVPAGVSEKLINQYACGLIRAGSVPETDRRHKTLMIIEKENPLWASDDGTMEYLEITVPEYPFAISCGGKYYKRSGSTLHELNGFELQNFLLERAGMTWDAVPLPKLKPTDLSKEALDAFRKKAVGKRRMTAAQASVPDEVLLDDLNLIEDGKLTRAAALIFHPDPEKFATGAYIKIGYFAPSGAYGKDKVDDIIYGDDIHGPLILQIDKAIDLIYTKYLKALFSYEGLQRIETFPWPEEAFREVLLNAVNHKSYETGIPIQIRIYEDKITIWNDGQWPKNIDVSKIYERHPSVPHNPKIANVFYRSGEIESWGSGFDKIKQECDKLTAPYPIINANPHGGVELECDACDLYMNLLKYGRYYDTYPQEAADSGDEKFAKGNQPVAAGLTSEEQKSVDRMMEVLSKKLNEKEKQKLLPLVDFLKTHAVISKKDVIKLTGKGDSTAKNYLKRLLELDVLSREGDSVATTYRRK